MEKALTRDQFRKHVFARDKNKCVICTEAAVDPHHIIERRLFTDGSYGYFLSNGASVCESCHLECEKTKISCDDLRTAAKIKNIILPLGWDTNKKYDKWGNTILENGTREPGPIFKESGVQKILKEVLYLFSNNKE